MTTKCRAKTLQLSYWSTSHTNDAKLTSHRKKKKKSTVTLVCVDYSTGLNISLKTLNYPLPCLENIFANLNSGKFFSKIDLWNAYLQIEMDKSCKKLLMINTHKGLFKFDRLPFGVKVAPNIFKQMMAALLAGFDFSVAYLDNILIRSKNRKEHAEHIKQVFKRIRGFGFKVNDTKCEFFMTSIKYLGKIIDTNRWRLDNKRCFVLKNMALPTNVSTLSAFLGLLNYYSIYISNIHKWRAPLNILLKKMIKCMWIILPKNHWNTNFRFIPNTLQLGTGYCDSVRHQWYWYWCWYFTQI